MSWFSRKPDTEQIGSELAQDMPDDLSEREVNRVLCRIAGAAECEGYSENETDDICGVAFRAWLIKVGRADEYPELF